MHLLERPPRSKRDRAASTSVLLEAAAVEFSRNGYSGTTMRMVAERAGRSESLIQSYFGGKEGLFVAVHEMSAPLAENLVRLVEQPGARTLEEDLALIVPALRDGLRRSIRHIRIVYQQVLADAQFAAYFREVNPRTVLRGVLADHLAARWLLAVDPIEAADLILGVVFELAFVYPEMQLRTEDDIERATVVACRVLGAGLAVRTNSA